MKDCFKLKKTWISSAHQGFIAGNIHSNTLTAYALAAQKGADMIETDARTTKDGVFIVNHDPTIKGFDKDGNAVEVTVSDTDYAYISTLTLSADRDESNRIPTLEETLNLAYFSGMCVNIDLKEGIAHAADIARLVVKSGMRGRTVYATNGSGVKAIREILAIDPEAKFIDTKANFTRENLCEIDGYPAKCFVYTWDFSEQNIVEIRESGCMLATIALNAENAAEAFKHHPDMAEYPHTSDFEAIDENILKTVELY